MTAKDILSSFNLVTTGNVSTQSDIVGDAVVGGDLKRSDLLWRRRQCSVLADPLPVRQAQRLAQPQRGRQPVLMRTPRRPHVNYNGGGKHYDHAAQLRSAYYTDPLTDLSTQLADLTATTGTSFVNGNFNAGSNTGVVVFEITGSELASDLVNHDISFTGKGVTSYIINVIGNFTDPNSTHFNVDQQDALFNFEDATTVNLGQWGASILAPDATVKITARRQYRGFGVRQGVPWRRRTAQQQPLQRRAAGEGACGGARFPSRRPGRC